MQALHFLFDIQVIRQFQKQRWRRIKLPQSSWGQSTKAKPTIHILIRVPLKQKLHSDTFLLSVHYHTFTILCVSYLSIQSHMCMQEVEMKKILWDLLFLLFVSYLAQPLPLICHMLPDLSLSRNYTLKVAQVIAVKIRSTGKKSKKRETKTDSEILHCTQLTYLCRLRNRSMEAEQLFGCNNSSRQGYSQGENILRVVTSLSGSDRNQFSSLIIPRRLFFPKA